MADKSNYSGNLLDEIFLSCLKNGRYLTATDFSEIWSHYDKLGNGYIDGNELENFLFEFCNSIIIEEFDKKSTGTKNKADILREGILEALATREKSKIEIAELAELLPTDEEFLLLFRYHNPLASSVQFMRIWKIFDKDKSGYIEADELKNFLQHLMKEANPDFQSTWNEDKLVEYTTTMLELFDLNKDGKLQLSEMSKLLPVKENFLRRPIFRQGTNITASDIENVFGLYDQNHDGTIHSEELEGFLKDLLELVQKDYDQDDLNLFRKVVMEQWDVNRDGCIDLIEMKMMLLQQTRMKSNSIDSNNTLDSSGSSNDNYKRKYSLTKHLPKFFKKMKL